MIRGISEDILRRVYDFSEMTNEELRCKFFQKLQECIDLCNNAAEIMDWVKNVGVENEVNELLNTWLEDGTLEGLIDLNILNQLKAELLEKVEENKNEIIAINKEMENNVKYKGVTLNAIEIGCDNTGAIGCTDIVQAKINEGYSILFPKGTFKLNIAMKPKITVEGSGIGVTNFIPEDINTNVINADKSCYEYTIKNFSIDGKNIMGTGSTNIKGIHLSNKGNLAQQDLEPHLENIKIVNCKIGLQVDEGIRGGLFKNIKSGACEIGINHLSTDCIFKDCITAQTQKHGIYVYQSNNIFINCKAFLAGLGRVIGAGIKVQGSYNRLIGCESQQNVFENLHLQNANNNIIQGLVLDGAGYRAKDWFPTLEYNDNGTVPISSLRVFNSNGNIINATIINGRLDSFCKCALYNQYVGNDNGNEIIISVKDTDTSLTKPFVDYILDDSNKYFKNNNVVINGSEMQNKTWTQPQVIDGNVEIVNGGYIVKDGICYLNMKVKALKTFAWDSEILQGLPRPLMDELQLAVNVTDRSIRLENNKIIVGTGITTNNTYKFSATYLIK